MNPCSSATTQPRSSVRPHFPGRHSAHLTAIQKKKSGSLPTASRRSTNGLARQSISLPTQSRNRAVCSVLLQPKRNGEGTYQNRSSGGSLPLRYSPRSSNSSQKKMILRPSSSAGHSPKAVPFGLESTTHARLTRTDKNGPKIQHTQHLSMGELRQFNHWRYHCLSRVCGWGPLSDSTSPHGPILVSCIVLHIPMLKI
jgi:hypothetical protein